VRRLQPWHSDVGKRLVPSPKVRVRDPGLTHALLGIRTYDELLGHPVVGPSYEAFAVESLLVVTPDGTEPSFYRSSGGAAIDLILDLPGGERWAVEIERSLAPKPTRGSHSACEDVEPSHRWLVYPGTESFPLRHDVEATPLRALCERLAARGG